MAFAVGSTNAGTTGAAGTTISWSHTIEANANKIVITITCNGTVSGVTVGGVSATQRSDANSGGNHAYTYTLDNPATGAQTIIVTKTSGVEVAAGSVTFIDAKAGIGAAPTATGFFVNPSNTVTTTGTGDGVCVDAIWSGNPPLTVGAGRTQIWNRPNYGGGARDGASSYESFTGGGNPSMDWTMSKDAWAWAAVEIQAAPIFTQTCTESVTWTDVFNQSRSRILSEASSWTDVLLTGVARALTLSETSTWTDVFTYVIARGQLMLESITWTDLFTRQVSAVKAEASTWTDVLEKQTTRPLTETATWTDVFNQSLSRILSEASTWTDRLRLFRNGLTTGIWSRTAKPTDQNSWSKTDKPDV